MSALVTSRSFSPSRDGSMKLVSRKIFFDHTENIDSMEETFSGMGLKSHHLIIVARYSYIRPRKTDDEFPAQDYIPMITRCEFDLVMPDMEIWNVMLKYKLLYTPVTTSGRNFIRLSRIVENVILLLNRRGYFLDPEKDA